MENSIPAAAPRVPQPEEAPAETWLMRTLKVVTLPVSAMIGYWVAKTDIRESAYDRLNRRGAFDDIKAKYEPQLNSMVDTARQKARQGKIIDITAEANAINPNYAAEVNERFNRFGLDTVYKRWNFIHKSQQQRVLMNSLTAAGISVGALFALANSETLAKAFRKKDADEKSVG